MPITPVAPILTMLTTSGFVYIFRGAETVLLNDPMLISAGTKVRAWTGDRNEDDTPNDDPTEFPMVRITRDAISGGWSDNITHTFDMSIEIKLWTYGVNDDDIANFALAVGTAFFPADGAQRANVDAWLQGNTDSADVSGPKVNIIRRELKAFSRPTKVGDALPYCNMATGSLLTRFEQFTPF